MNEEKSHVLVCSCVCVRARVLCRIDIHRVCVVRSANVHIRERVYLHRRILPMIGIEIDVMMILNRLQQIQFVCLTEPYILNNFSRTRVSKRAHIQSYQR
jgi:hypothetical protein